MMSTPLLMCCFFFMVSSVTPSSLIPPIPTPAPDGTPFIFSCPVTCICVSFADVTCEGMPGIPFGRELIFAGLSLTQVPVFQGVYVDITTIDLSGNMITVIRRDSFLEENFPNLQAIILRENRITVVEQSAFQIPTLELLDLSDNRLDSFGSLPIRDVGPSFQTLRLDDNNIQDMNLDEQTFNREEYPSLAIFFAGNVPPCDQDFLPTLCYFLVFDGSQCQDTGTENVLTLLEVCLELLQLSQPSTNNDVMSSISNSTSSSDDTDATVVEVIIGASVAGVFIVVLLVLVIALVAVCVRLRTWKKRYTYVVQEAGTRHASFVQMQVPQRSATAPLRYFKAGAGSNPKFALQPNPDDRGDSIYEDIYADLQPLPESDYDPNTGYILTVASVPSETSGQFQKESALDGSAPAYEVPDITGADESLTPHENQDEKRDDDSAYLKIII